MMIELDGTFDNAKISLLEDMGEGYIRTGREFYTASRIFIFEGSNRFCGAVDSKLAYDVFYLSCDPPRIGGMFARWHPYWENHPEQFEKWKERQNGSTD